MTAIEVLHAVERVGGSLALNGNQIKYAIPRPAVWLVTELKQHREELIGLLREEGTPPPMPTGVRLLKWQPKDPPVAIVHMGIVGNVHKFAAATLLQLQARLDGKDYLAGNWSLREILDRLEQVGVAVEIESTPICREER
jgi:hypothetical protein